MNGIVFFGTNRLEAVIDYYLDRFDAKIWLEQPDCTIIRLGTLLLGFCTRDRPDTEGTITIVTGTMAEVDALFEAIDDPDIESPIENDRYDIYHFYTEDPEGRNVEVQTFLHDIEPP